MPYRLSPSSLKLYTDCPRCFWLKHNEKIERPRGIFPSMGSKLDLIIKNHFDNFRPDIPPELDDTEAEEYMLFNNTEKLKEFRNPFKGLRYEDGQGNILMGAVDELIIKDNKIAVLDYKTRGYPPKEDTYTYYQNQLNIYSFLLEKNNYQTHNHAFLLFYFPSNIDDFNNIEFSTELVKLDINKKAGVSLFENALDTLYSSEPAPQECGFCELANTLNNRNQNKIKILN